MTLYNGNVREVAWDNGLWAVSLLFESWISRSRNWQGFETAADESSQGSHLLASQGFIRHIFPEITSDMTQTTTAFLR